MKFKKIVEYIINIRYIISNIPATHLTEAQPWIRRRFYEIFKASKNLPATNKNSIKMWTYY